MTIELAFDLKAVQKEDKSVEYTVFQEKNRLPKHSVVHVYDTVTGCGPCRFHVVAVTQPMPNASSFVHKLVPLPKPEVPCWG